MRLASLFVGLSLISAIAIASTTKAAMAPQFRWEMICKPRPEPPQYPLRGGVDADDCRPIGSDYYAIGAPANADTKLEKFNVTVFCNSGCDFDSRYHIASPRGQQVRLTLFSAAPNSLRIELAHHAIIAAVARKPEPKDFEPYGVVFDSVDPSLNAIDISIPLIAGTNELTIHESAMMKTRGRGTDQVIRLISSRFSMLQKWRKSDDFSLLINFGFEQGTISKSDGLKEDRVEPLCHAYVGDSGKSEVPFVGYRNEQTGRPMFPMLYRFAVPDFVSCWLGGRSALQQER